MSGADRVLALLQAQRYPEAVAEAARQLAITPDDPELLVLGALAESQQGHHDLAIQWVERAAWVAPESAYTQRWFATVHDSAGNHAVAIDAARRAVGLGPHDADNWVVLAECASRLAPWEGRAAALRAIELEPDRAACHHALGMNLRGREQEAAYRRALELDPNLTATRGNLARSVERRDPAAAAELFAGLVRADPRRTDAHRAVLGIASRRRSAWAGLVGGIAVAIGAAIWTAVQPPGANLNGGAGYGAMAGIAVGASIWTLWRTAPSRELLAQVRLGAESTARVSRRTLAAGPPAVSEPATATALRDRGRLALASALATAVLVVAAIATSNPWWVFAAVVTALVAGLSALHWGTRRWVLRVAPWEELPAAMGMRSGIGGIVGPWLLRLGTDHDAVYAHLSDRQRRWWRRHPADRAWLARRGVLCVVTLPGSRRLLLATTGLTANAAVKDAGRFRQLRR